MLRNGDGLDRKGHVSGIGLVPAGVGDHTLVLSAVCGGSGGSLDGIRIVTGPVAVDPGGILIVAEPPLVRKTRACGFHGEGRRGARRGGDGGRVLRNGDSLDRKGHVSGIGLVAAGVGDHALVLSAVCGCSGGSRDGIRIVTGPGAVDPGGILIVAEPPLVRKALASGFHGKGRDSVRRGGNGLRVGGDRQDGLFPLRIQINGPVRNKRRYALVFRIETEFITVRKSLRIRIDPAELSVRIFRIPLVAIIVPYFPAFKMISCFRESQLRERQKVCRRAAGNSRRILRSHSLFIRMIPHLKGRRRTFSLRSKTRRIACKQLVADHRVEKVFIRRSGKQIRDVEDFSQRLVGNAFLKVVIIGIPLSGRRIRDHVTVAFKRLFIRIVNNHAKGRRCLADAVICRRLRIADGSDPQIGDLIHTDLIAEFCDLTGCAPGSERNGLYCRILFQPDRTQIIRAVRLKQNRRIAQTGYFPVLNVEIGIRVVKRIKNRSKVIGFLVLFLIAG